MGQWLVLGLVVRIGAGGGGLHPGEHQLEQFIGLRGGDAEGPCRRQHQLQGRAAEITRHRLETGVPSGIAPEALDRALAEAGFHVRGQTLKPRARSISRPSSVILSGPHGGIHTQLMATSPAMPSRAPLVWSAMTSVSGQAAEVRVMSRTTSLPSRCMP